MDEKTGVKLTGIKQIVRLKEILQKWQTITIGHKLEVSSLADEKHKESSRRLELPVDVPKGYLAVYVGPELRRFVVPTTYLSHSLFKVLLEKAEEEFGFDQGGALTIPCEVETFKYLLKCMENKNQEPDDNSAGDTVLENEE